MTVCPASAAPSSRSHLLQVPPPGGSPRIETEAIRNAPNAHGMARPRPASSLTRVRPEHDYAIRHVNRDTGAYEFATIVKAGTEYPTPEPVKQLTIKAIRDGQRQLGIAVYELAHASYREASSDLEIVFDANGGARTVPVTAQRRQERYRLWLNEDSPTLREADPPAEAGV